MREWWKNQSGPEVDIQTSQVWLGLQQRRLSNGSTGKLYRWRKAQHGATNSDGDYKQHIDEMIWESHLSISSMPSSSSSSTGFGFGGGGGMPKLGTKMGAS